MKRRSSLDTSQLGFSFEPQAMSREPAAFAGAEARAAAEIARALKADPRSREEIAGAMSAALAHEVSREMLDAYASPARDKHNISFARALAFMAVTNDREMIERAVNQLGGSILWGAEINTARLGHLRAQERTIKAEIKRIEQGVTPIERGQR